MYHGLISNYRDTIENLTKIHNRVYTGRPPVTADQIREGMNLHTVLMTSGSSTYRYTINGEHYTVTLFIRPSDGFLWDIWAD